MIGQTPQMGLFAPVHRAFYHSLELLRSCRNNYVLAANDQ